MNNEITALIDTYDRLLSFPNYLEVMHPEAEQVNHDRDFKILCPIHEEKTPSFLYSKNMGVWTCFGSCHTTGKTAKFHHMMMKKKYGEQVTVIQALNHLQSIFPHILPPIKKATEVSKRNVADKLEELMINENREIDMIPRGEHQNNIIMAILLRD